MIKVLIVDDEPLVQVGIKSILNWADMNMEICGTASNGQVALKLIEEHSPEIVITDIKMPVMSGLEMIKVCRDTYGTDKPHFIILTSYEDFHMVKEALTYQVSDYLLKLELNAETLKSTLEKVVKSLPANDTAVKASHYVDSYNEKFFIKLLHNLFEDDEQFQLQSRELGLNFNRLAYLSCYGEFIGAQVEALPTEKQAALFSSSLQMLKELISKYSQCHVISLDIRHFALLFYYDNTPSDDFLGNISRDLSSISTSLEKYYNVKLKCGIGNLVEEYTSISDSFQNARAAFREASADHPLIAIEEIKSDDTSHNAFNISLFKNDITKALEEYDGELFQRTIASICDIFKEHPSYKLQALDASSNILYLTISLLQDGENSVESLFSNEPEGYRSLYKRTDVAQIIDWLETFSNRLCTLLDEHKKEFKNHTVTQVKKYISTHVKERLSLNEVAAIFAVNPSYLSQLFSKYNDCGFVEYVNSQKMKEAKRLMDETTLKVYEISDMLGFESAFYFSKVFKKIEGVAPSEYINSRK